MITMNKKTHYKVKNPFQYFLRKVWWKERCSGECTCEKVVYGHVMGYFQSEGKVDIFIVLPEGKEHYLSEKFISAEVINLEE